MLSTASTTGRTVLWTPGSAGWRPGCRGEAALACQHVLGGEAGVVLGFGGVLLAACTGDVGGRAYAVGALTVGGVLRCIGEVVAVE